MKLYNSLRIVFITVLIAGCYFIPQKENSKSVPTSTNKVEENIKKDSILDYYIPLAIKNIELEIDNEFYRSDVEETRNIERPTKSYVSNPKFDVNNLYGVWGGDETEPVSEFQIDSQLCDIADYDGDANMPYIYTNDSLFIFYND
jgi:hypothetical protein